MHSSLQPSALQVDSHLCTCYGYTYQVDSHIGVAMSGLSADARTLVDHARSETQYHRFTFNELTLTHPNPNPNPNPNPDAGAQASPLP